MLSLLLHLIYQLLYPLIIILCLPIVLFQSFRDPATAKRFFHRLGLHGQKYQKQGIIVHASSVGEVIALQSFVEKLIASYPQLPITITTFTKTGNEQVNKLFADRVQCAYLPQDFFLSTFLFLTRLKPQLIIFMETEIWPNLIWQASLKKIQLLLINARLSNNSVASYQKILPLMTKTLNRFDYILCQSPESYQNFCTLGADTSRCEQVGNLKFDININARIEQKQQELAPLLAIAQEKQRPILLLASSHDGDEALALKAFAQIKQQYANSLLIIVPRHPERFNTVEKLCKKQGYSVVKRSDNVAVDEQDIWLLDTLGELSATFSFADIVIMAGSFSHIGGHNPLEPALFKKAIVTGNNMANFMDITLQLKKHKALVNLSSASGKENRTMQSEELASITCALLAEPNKRARLGENAYQVVMDNQGASQRCIDEVNRLLNHAKSKTTT